jgi:hypothetical protein
MGSCRGILAALGAALALAACGTNGHRPDAPDAAGRLNAYSHSSSPTPATSRAATPSPAPSPGPGAAQPPAQYGNPDGHAVVPAAGQAVSIAHPDHVIGDGTPASCTSDAVVATVALGGIITFNCGPNPVTITMTATAEIVNGSQIVIDGGGKVTLSGAGNVRILDSDTCSGCWEQTGPSLIVQNMRFIDGYSGTQQTGSDSHYGGGAIFDQGGQLTVVNSDFADNGCYQYGPDLGGGAIRAYGMDMSAPVYITDDTFTGNKCSNGGALSGLYANFVVINSLLTSNNAIGWGQNPAQSGTPGGGSGGAIYTDGDSYDLVINGSALTGNSAREGGGGIFCVVNNDQGALTIESSVMQNNTSGQFQDAPGIFDSLDGHDVQPTVTGSTVS